MVSVPDILLKVAFHPDLLERWMVKNSEQKPRCSDCLNQPILSCLQSWFDVWTNQFGSVTGSRFHSAREVQVLLPVWWSGFKQVGSGWGGDFWETLQHPSCLSYAGGIFLVFFLLLRRLHSQTLEHFWRENWVQCEVAAGCRLKEHTSCICADLL